MDPPFSVDLAPALLEYVARPALNPDRRVAKYYPEVPSFHQTGLGQYYVNLLATSPLAEEFERGGRPWLERIQRTFRFDAFSRSMRW